MSPKSVSFNVLLAAAGILALAGRAFAADLAQAPPPPPVFNWTGVFLGGQIGYAWGDGNGAAYYATPGGLFGSGALNSSAQGVIGGAHLGYNLQINNFVVGLEGTIDGTNLSKTTIIGIVDPSGGVDASGNAYGGPLTGSVQSNIQGSILGRAGLVWDRLLIYGVGGVTSANYTSYINISAEDSAGSYYFHGTRSSTRTGWTAGGGAEYAINDHWSVYGEYRHSEFGQLSSLPSSPVAGLGYYINRQLAQNQVQVGFSYRFNSVAPAPVVAKY